MIDLALWLKWLHIVAVIAWMAALLYMPRLFVYHSKVAPGTEASETFKIMERRLLKAIMTPAMLASLLFGISLGVVQAQWIDAWLHIKTALVIALAISHMMMARYVRLFAARSASRQRNLVSLVQRSPHAFDVGDRLLGGFQTVLNQPVRGAACSRSKMHKESIQIDGLDVVRQG